MPPVEEKKELEEDFVPPQDEPTGDTPPEGYTQSEWDDLSEGERDAILKTDEKGEFVKEEEPPAKEEVDEEALAKIAAEEPKVEDIPPVVDETKAPEVIAEDKIDVSDDDLLNYVPVIDESKLPPLPDDLEEVIPEDVQTAITALEVKFNDGDLTNTEYIKEMNILNRKIVSYNFNLNQDRRAEALKSREEAKSGLEWSAVQQEFFKAKPEYKLGKDVSAKDRALFGALNAMVQHVTGDNKYSRKSLMEQLLIADKMTKESLGMATGAAPKGDIAKAKPKDNKPSAKVPDAVTLADVPAAKDNSTSNPWGTLDNLKGDDYEKALSKLTPEQLDRYLKSGR